MINMTRNKKILNIKNIKNMKDKSLLLLLSILLFTNYSYSQSFEINSPDNKIKLDVKIEESISWSATFDGISIIENVAIGMDFSSGSDFGKGANVKNHSKKNISTKIYPVISHKDSEIIDEYAELSISFKEDFKIVFRAYNDGVAYQFIDEGKKNRDLNSELMSITFPAGATSLFPHESYGMYSGNECSYLDKKVEDISKKEFCSLPVLFITGKTKVLFTETALHNYPGMFVRGNNSRSMDAIFPDYLLEMGLEEGSDRHEEDALKGAGYIAKVSGKRSYPWRVFVISNDDRALVESNLTYQLAKPLAIKKTDWIKPGKVAWDWYNDWNIHGVDFKAGINTATYKYYIDFASANGIEYVILDEGWSKTTHNLLEFQPEIDVKELISYGKEKNVDIILWALWHPLDKNMDEILKTFNSWGAKGIKVDFMQRNDQYMVESYERIAEICAKYELLVDFHGSFKPSGLRRMYPNVINYEGVKGNEWNKWDIDAITPEHNVTIPFIRMVAGPMDYTPGSMTNRLEVNYDTCWYRPMTRGTRAHQVAMYVVYEAPLQMLCESPTIYYKEQETVDYITKIPTTWDKTNVLHGKVGDYIAVARRNNGKWYIGAMTDENARKLEIDFSFLGDGDFEVIVFKDGINVNKNAEDYKVEKKDVNKDTRMPIEMAAGGGWTAIISRK